MPPSRSLLRFLAHPAIQFFAFAATTGLSISAAMIATPPLAMLLHLQSSPWLNALGGALIVGFVWFSSTVLLRPERRTLVSALGLTLDRKNVSALSLCFGVAAAVMLGVAAIQSAKIGAHWTPQGFAGLRAAALGLLFTLVNVLTEELVFRGAAFRALRAWRGDRTALVLSAVVFGCYHLVGTRMWGSGALLLFLLPALGGLLFGWIVIRTRSLLPAIGLHWGFNWVNQCVAPFTPPDTTPPQALWHLPYHPQDFNTLLSPDLIDRLPYLLALLTCATACHLLFHRAATPEAAH